MEDLFNRIIKEATGNKYKQIRELSQHAHDFLESQQGQLRASPHELREKCFSALRLALDSKNDKLVALSISGLQKLLRDDRFQSQLECESESEWLPSQLLETIGGISRHPEDIQVDLMKILLNMACGTWWSMNDIIILRILQMCEYPWISGGSSSIQVACKATASQTIRAFCTHLEEEDRAVKKNPYLSSFNVAEENGTIVSAFDKVLPIFKYFTKELHFKIRNNHMKRGAVYFLLESLLSLVSCLPSVSMLSLHLQTYMWKEFCPDLLSLLGPPVTCEKGFTLKSSVESLASRSHRSTQLYNDEARYLYAICVELIRLAGSILSLRPMLESVFHRILFYSSPSHRLEVLKSIRELLKSPNLLLEFCGPLVNFESKRKSCGSDLGLLKLTMDALVECSQCSDFSLCCASVQCVVSMLISLEHLCEGVGLIDIQVDNINSVISTLEDADYHGPMTYQKWEKLQKSSNEVIENLDTPPDRGNVCSSLDEAKEWDSESSLSTEGPEDIDLEIENNFADEDDFEEEEEDDNDDDSQQQEVAKKRERIPKSLIGSFEENDIFCGELYAQQERANAQHFSRVLLGKLSHIINIRTSIAMDEALQSFASDYCQEIMNSSTGNNVIIINADGIYLATYTALLLNLKLSRTNFYKNPKVQDPPINEEEFIESVHGSGVLVYLSATWLAELYQIILSRDLLSLAGFNISTSENCQLVNLLDDLEGTSGILRGAHLLSDYSKLVRVSTQEQNPRVEAGKKFARRVLTASWTDIVHVLSILLTDDHENGTIVNFGSALGVDSAKEKRRKVMETVALCLDGLQRVAKLSNLLNLHQRCESVFYFLVNVSCPSFESSISTKVKERNSLQNLLGSSRIKSQKLHSAHVQSMDVILSRGLELGSYSPECWQHVFRCCLYVYDLERFQFSRGPTSSISTSKKVPTIDDGNNKKDACDEENGTINEMNVSVAEVVKLHADSKGILSATASLQVVCNLSQQADQLFEDAALTLNLRSLLAFLKVLCTTNQKTLYSAVSRRSAHDNGLCLVQRIGGSMLNIARSGRPLIHVMQCWSVVGLHLIEAACHPEQTIAKRAVAGIHDVVNALLSNQPEMPHFHFNEALFKPFEKLLCLELCDADIQDQILMSICEYVEGCTTEIKSGWKPLFGALKAVRPNPQANYYRCTALDVIEAFLNTENAPVFCNAVVDCILCLLTHIRVASIEEPDSSLCVSCLKYIDVTCSHLIEMQKLSSYSSFTSSSKVKVNPHVRLVDLDIPTLIYHQFSQDDELFEAPWRLNKKEIEQVQSLEDLEHSTGIMRVWYLILDGLISAATQFPCIFHQQKLDTLCNLIKKMIDQPPGTQFGLFVINHLLLPAIQDWLRQIARTKKHLEPNAISYFKQCCGQSSELVVNYLIKINEAKIEVNGVSLMLKQLLWLMVECVAQPVENISRLGCSCIRHVIISAGSQLSEEHWKIIVENLVYCCYVSLFSLRQLMVAFKGHSDNFYGDIGQVRVAARCNCFPGENERLKHLAEQVFHLEDQLLNENHVKNILEDEEDDDRSYIFLLQPPDSEENSNKEVVSVHLQSLIIGLVAHQILLQTLGNLLLEGVTRTVPALSNILILQSPIQVSTGDENVKMPGVCNHLNKKEILLLLHSLDDSFDVASQFDSRPGLKFLVQKVSRIHGSAANLYKQMGASWTIKCIFLFELHLYQLVNGRNDNEDIWLKQKLHETLDQILKVYSELTERKNEADEEWDRLSNQPIFFLVAHPDEYPFKTSHTDSADETTNMSDPSEKVEAQEERVDIDNKTIEEFEKVYDVASQKDVEGVVNEYKKRKQHCSLPTAKTKENSEKKTSLKEESKIPSAFRDQEVRVRICNEMLLSVFTYLSQVSDPHFFLLLPTVYPFFLSLLAVANECNLRQSLVLFLERVAQHYGFHYK